MREIKFRAWDKKRNKMFDSYSVNNNGEFCVDTDYTNTCECKGGENLIQLQFTGLKDKNEKDIYEGDIIQAETYTGFYKGIIVFGNGCFSLKITETKDVGYDVGQTPLLDAFEKLEIIGNIYENPELVKTK